MKKQMKYLIVVLIAITAIMLNGCLLDDFNTLTQQIPITVEVHSSTAATSYEQSITTDLNQNNFYADNQSKINSIALVNIAYKTKSVSPTDLTGTITITVKQSNGLVLFSKIIPGNKPSDYLVNPYELQLTQPEIQLVNAYLAILTNRTFITTVNIQTTTNGTKTIDADIFTVFTMDYKL
jgi:hypothetical protein